MPTLSNRVVIAPSHADIEAAKGALYDDRLLDRIGHASAALADAPAPRDDDAPTGGFRAAALNHLAGPSALREWVELTQQEAQAIQRVREFAADRAQLETHLALIGVPRAALERALAEAGGLRIVAVGG